MIKIFLVQEGSLTKKEGNDMFIKFADAKILMIHYDGFMIRALTN